MLNEHESYIDPDEEDLDWGDGPVFPTNDKGRRRFTKAFKAYKASGKSMAEFFGAKPYYMSESGVRKAAERLRVEITTPQRKKADRRQVLINQRQDGTPLDVVAYRENVKVDTLRTWSKQEKLPFSKNTKLGRRQWWYKQFRDTEPHEVPAQCVMDKLPWHLAVVMYHEVRDPIEFIAWDFSPGIGGRTDLRVTMWTQAEYESAVSVLPGTNELEKATLIAGHRKFTTPLMLPERTTAEDPAAINGELPVREFGATTPFDEEAM